MAARTARALQEGGFTTTHLQHAADPKKAFCQTTGAVHTTVDIEAVDCGKCRLRMKKAIEEAGAADPIGEETPAAEPEMLPTNKQKQDHRKQLVDTITEATVNLKMSQHDVAKAIQFAVGVEVDPESEEKLKGLDLPQLEQLADRFRDFEREMLQIVREREGREARRKVFKRAGIKQVRQQLHMPDPPVRALLPPVKKPGPICLCGCGERTKGGRFRPGHDARWYARAGGHKGH